MRSDNKSQIQDNNREGKLLRDRKQTHRTGAKNTPQKDKTHRTGAKNTPQKDKTHKSKWKKKSPRILQLYVKVAGWKSAQVTQYNFVFRNEYDDRGRNI